MAVLRAELDVGWPHRDTSSDGFIGDDAHQARKSDHNPDEDGYVRAADFTHDPHQGPPLWALAAFLRDVGASGSQRLNPGGLVIYDHRYASERTEWRWITYPGDNPHVTHLHVSCSRLPPLYKISRTWHVIEAIAQRVKRGRHAIT